MPPTVPPSAIAPFDHISSSSCFLWASLHWSWLLLTFSPPCPSGTIVASGARLPKVGSTRLVKTGQKTVQFENNSQQFKQTSRMACGPTPMVCPPASMPQAPLPARCWTILTSGVCKKWGPARDALNQAKNNETLWALNKASKWQETQETIPYKSPSSPFQCTFADSCPNCARRLFTCVQVQSRELEPPQYIQNGEAKWTAN